MKCANCGIDFQSKSKTRPQKYCSDECRKQVKKIRQRKYDIKSGVCLDHGLLTKQCPICGKTFETYRSTKVTCSDKCRKIRGRNRRRTKEEERARYVKSHPGAKTMDQIQAEAMAKKEAKTKAKEEREKALENARQKKAKEKALRIEYWQHYEKEHECCYCGKKFIAHYPTTKYCSNACKRKPFKEKDRYSGITVDKNITLRRLAKRDHNLCKICGLFVDWNDKEEIDGTVVCGDYYPSIDHITPISKGGLHSWNNVQLAHRRCNYEKGDKTEVTA